MTRGSEMIDLGTLAGNTSSIGLSINSSGQVTGYSFGPGQIYQYAFLYSGGKMINLNTLIPASSGWTLMAAFGINDSGQITGYGPNPSGVIHAFLLTPVPTIAYLISLVGSDHIPWKTRDMFTDTLIWAEETRNNDRVCRYLTDFILEVDFARDVHELNHFEARQLINDTEQIKAARDCP
jgi:probable HAF family extracellular repeat protein